MELQTFIVIGSICVAFIYAQHIKDQYEFSIKTSTQKLTYYELSNELADTLNSFFTNLPDLPLPERMRKCKDILNDIDMRIQRIQKVYNANCTHSPLGENISELKEEQAMLCLLEEIFAMLSQANLVDAYDLNPYIRYINDLIHVFVPSIPIESLQYFKKT